MAKIESVSNIKTSIPQKTVTFFVDSKVNYKDPIAQYAETNSHLAEYQQIE